ncbi:hypothetical protein [Extibacter muris]|uniref:hypothetical protein n=1 Tax=Extibacter muris TaxID=1796622 RepID=UPI001D06C395|nr:hypothetical protein [Extibacter muris]MCB6201071.1 hypothetical protein [Extibacter muris]MCQ4662401.1 hypothetical protein [Extibacter muris]MCQ4691672.1 hypothetical protein [Extibacter muris]
MKVTVHYPNKEQDKRKLEQRVAIIHSEAVRDYILNQNCFKEEKQQLISHVTNIGRKGLGC